MQIERAESVVVDDDHPTKPVPVVEEVDYSGSHEKTDPREIALITGVLQPTLFAMYFLNYHDHNLIALARLNDGFKNFFPTVVKTLGLNRTVTLCSHVLPT
ncbi:hypothetical protein BU25DRAFT_421028 [Macroventuria anomochaeta]|uniref:Uncharacterized protein n=1 Tax=Macroventuria anomochaeta TaxID=301207 RepID=A0ACB6S3G9_9PLEO|nr:uncharacterized protein BU25DRAFT_421028 [Macroventuria anomochaeta]KAF2628578.1 hypothetical protein BU25DRAFT_421028 [Macroventuria anomochaeta]